MNPTELLYTEDHEWIGEEDGHYVAGITDFAQEQLGDITYVELPEMSMEVAKSAEVAVVQSVRTTSDIYAPVSGLVCAVNMKLESAPELINRDPYGEGWFFKLEDVDEADLGGLMDAAAYKSFCEEQGE